MTRPDLSLSSVVDSSAPPGTLPTLAPPRPSMDRIQVQVRVRNTPTWRQKPLSPRFRAQWGIPPPNPSLELLREVQCVDVNCPQSLRFLDPDESRRRENREFAFDRVLSPLDSQEDVYNAGARQFIEKALEGYNACIFAYGQTASGKTYTMNGPSGTSNPSDSNSKERGLIHRAIEQIRKHIQAQTKRRVDLTGEKIRVEYSVEASFLEIYQETLKDLLCENGAQAELRIRMDPESVTGDELHVQGLTERHVVELADYLKILDIGAKHRTVAETNMNQVSSRSHAVFTLSIEQIIWRESDQTIKSRTRSKIHFIDLAGSERANLTGATGDRLKEGSMINQSLLSLGIVISALSKRSETSSGKKSSAGLMPKPSGHIPYRDSKLTYLLSDCLGGNSLTLMIACVTPTGACYSETLSTLRFAERAKKVTNRPRVNLDPTSLRVQELEAEIARLRALLALCVCQGAGKKRGPLNGLWEKLSSAVTSRERLLKWRLCVRVADEDVITDTVSGSDNPLTRPSRLLPSVSSSPSSSGFPLLRVRLPTTASSVLSGSHRKARFVRSKKARVAPAAEPSSSSSSSSPSLPSVSSFFASKTLSFTSLTNFVLKGSLGKGSTASSEKALKKKGKGVLHHPSGLPSGAGHHHGHHGHHHSHSGHHHLKKGGNEKVKRKTLLAPLPCIA